ncbi:DNA ligase/mRNA capping enzyme, partial [Stereum hirsutum FP-91666 SS1]|uniref:DNA ligase/mRNA capping enzyme n=1 Tax=Stereum hirsutum (strain FP-91666) TaxID=721885 RepID=UPI000440DEE1
SSSKYKVKRTMDHYYCTCPAWRNQSAHPVSARTCKHLRSLLGDAYEEARLKLKNPNGPAATATKSTSKGRNGSIPSAKKKAPEVLLAVKWDEESTDPTGWWVSEKLDGVRTLWAPKGGEGREGAMLSRLGNPFMVPKDWMDKLPKDVTLDGELFGGRGEFQSTVGIVKTMGSKGWKNITFQIFDVPSMGNEPFEDRLQWLQENFSEGGKYHSKEFVVVDQTCAESKDHVFDMLKEVEAHGGEGLMLRKPGSKYEGRRSSTLLKIKTFFDAEAEVTGYVPGKGKHTGSTGALKCKMASGKTFAVGSGLSDKQRARPPKVGTIIVYRFQELTKDGVPRFPTFVGEAADKTVAKDAEVPASRKV